MNQTTTWPQDTLSPTDRLIYGMQQSIAHFAIMNGARITTSLPLGYLASLSMDEERDVFIQEIAVDVVRGPLISEGFCRFATGEYSLARLRRELTDHGLTTWPTRRSVESPVSKKQLKDLLRNEFYLGASDEDRPHATLVDREIFDRVQQLLDEIEASTRGIAASTGPRS